MGFLRQLAFYLGLALGLITVTVAGTVALTYLFTGRFPSVMIDSCPIRRARYSSA